MSEEILALNSTRHFELISKSPHNSKFFGNEQEREEMLKRVQQDGKENLVMF